MAAADGKTGVLRAALQINSVSSTIIRPCAFSIFDLFAHSSLPTFPPSYARVFPTCFDSFLLRASLLLEKGDRIISRRLWWWGGALHKQCNLNSSPLKRPLPLAKPGGNLGSRTEKNAGDNYWRAEEKGKSCGWLW